MRDPSRLLRFAAAMLAATMLAAACQCDVSLSACDSAGASDLVFAGKVVSIQPAFLSRWNRKASASIGALNEAYAEARDLASPASLSRLKETFRTVFPALPDEEKSELAAAVSATQVMTLFNTLADRGLEVRFEVLDVYKHQVDDDKDDNDAVEAPAWIEVSTPFGDCGIDFEPGETYLVYANGEEGAAAYSTGSCTRTRRLSDAGDDLAYLFYYRRQHAAASRIEGFTTTDSRTQMEFSRLHNMSSIPSPAPGVVVEIDRVGSDDHPSRHAAADENGRFVVDGLAEGEYVLSAWAPGYPSTTQSLSGEIRVKVGGLSCAKRILVVHPIP